MIKISHLIALSLALQNVVIADSLSPGPVVKTGGNLYVGKSGKAGGNGTRESPFATLEGVRDAIRESKRFAGLPKGGITVWIGGGDYWLPATFQLSSEDSGTKDAPVIYRPTAGQTVRLYANTRVDSQLWKPLSAAAAKRVHPKVDPSKLVELDLTKVNLQRVERFAPGNRFTDQWHIIDLSANDRNQPVSQWPNPTEAIRKQNEGGWATMNGSKDDGAFHFGSGGNPQDGDTVNEVDLDGTRRSERWRSSLANGHEIWLKGVWRTSWEPHTIKVAAMDSKEQWIRLAEPPPGGMGSKYTKAVGEKAAWRVGSGKENWCALNLLDEIDLPGEWALDFKDQKIYFYPPGPVAEIGISIADRDTPLVRISGASFLSWLGIEFSGGMGHGIEIVDGTNNLVAGCTFNNIGNSGIRLERGFRNTLQSNDIANGAGWGIELQEVGDLKTLKHSESVVLNNHIHHAGRLAFKEAIRVTQCIGITFSHNLMHDLPKGAVRSDVMNDCRFEYNEVHNIALRESDTGSFYNYGGWTTYGNVWRYNFIHHTNRANGFYSDDGDSGDNYVKNIVQGGINGLHLGGGHHNLALNNIFIENKIQSVDDRGIGRGYRAETAYGKKLRAMKPDAEPWKSYGENLSRKYSYKAKLWHDILDPAWKPEQPNGSIMADNVSVASGAFRAPPNKGVEVRDNVMLKSVAMAGFRDYAGMDLRSDNREILSKFPELNEVFPRIGLRIDAYRVKVPDRKETGGLSNRGKDEDVLNEDPLK